MDWRDEGTLIQVRPHGETSAIIEVFTPERGRHAGVVRGGQGRKLGPVLQPGAQLDVTWRARLADHVGSYQVEPLRSRAAQVLGDPPALAALSSLTALLGFALPERAPYPALYRATQTVLDMLGVDPDWPLAYLLWEKGLLEELGFALDLSRCAVTGRTEGLIYVSPKSGRAVSAEGAGDWAERLLPLPPCLVGTGPADAAGLRAGLRTTGFFLANRLAASLGDRPLPAARQRLIDMF